MDSKPGQLSQTDYDRFNDVLEKTLQQLRHLRLPGNAITVDEQSRLGRGGFADVWAGTLSQQSRVTPMKVAVKKLRPKESLDDVLRTSVALARELRAWATLQHPSILPLLGFYLDPKSLSAWIITPLAAKGNARQYFKQTNPDSAQRFDVILDITNALTYLHDRDEPVCHGDLKPDNILMNDDGKALLSDFGSSFIVQESPSGLTTTTALHAGTVRYMAPELFKDEKARRTFASDVWSWACVAAELMTGNIPYHKVKVDLLVLGEIVGAHTPPDFLHRVQDFPVPLLRWACDPKPERRPGVRQCLEILQPTTGTEHVEFLVPKTGAPSRVFTASVVGYPVWGSENGENRSAWLDQSIDHLVGNALWTTSEVDAKGIAFLSENGMVEFLDVVTGHHRTLIVPNDEPYDVQSAIYTKFTPNLSHLIRAYTVQPTTVSGVNSGERPTARHAEEPLTVVHIWDLEDGSLCHESRIPTNLGSLWAVYPLNGNEWIVPYHRSVILQKVVDGVVGITHFSIGPIIDGTISPGRTLMAIAWRWSSSQPIMLDIKRTSNGTTIGTIALPFKIKSMSDFGISDTATVVVLDDEANLWHWDLSSTLSNPPSDGVIQSTAQLIAYGLPSPTLYFCMMMLPQDGSWVVIRYAEERLIIDLQTMVCTALRSVDGSPLKNPRTPHALTGANGLDVTSFSKFNGSHFMLKYEVFNTEEDLNHVGETSGLPLGSRNRLVNFCDLY